MTLYPGPSGHLLGDRWGTKKVLVFSLIFSIQDSSEMYGSELRTTSVQELDSTLRAVEMHLGSRVMQLRKLLAQIAECPDASLERKSSSGPVFGWGPNSIRSQLKNRYDVYVTYAS